VAPRDRSAAYGDRAVAIIVGPLELPSAEEVRERLAQFAARSGVERLLCSIDVERGRWLPVGQDGLQRHLERSVLALAPADEIDLASWAATALSESASDGAFRISIGSRFACVALSHAVGDALTVHQVLPALYGTEYRELPPRVVGKPPRALIGRAIAHHYGESPGRAIRLLRTSQNPMRRSRPSAAQAASQAPKRSSFKSWDMVSAHSPPGYVRRFRRLFDQSGITLAPVLFASARRLLWERVDWPRDEPMLILCDVRRYLPRRTTGYLGNFATAIDLQVADACNAVALDKELRRKLEYGAPLAAMALGSVKAAVGRDRRVVEGDHKPAVCFTHHGNLRTYEKLAWKGGPAERRFLQPARPHGDLALTLSFAVLSTALHVTASFDSSVFSRPVIREIADQLCADLGEADTDDR
jgi:hypothetical protein